MSTTWSLNAGQLATAAYRKMGRLSSGGTMTADQTFVAIQAMNAMLKGMQADGINLYRQTQLSLTVGALQGTPTNPISITPLIMGLEEARWVVEPVPNLYERPLGMFSYLDYMNLPNKHQQTNSGPSVITLDKQVNQSLLYIWPLHTFGGTLNCTVGRTVNDVNSVNDPLDFPTEWTEGMEYTLADRLLDDFGIAAADPVTSQRITERSVAFYSKLLNFDRPTSVFVRPWGKKGTGKFWR